MSTLSERLEADLKQSMKNKEADKLGVLRMLKAAIMNSAIAKKKDLLTDPEILDVIEKQAKQRKESYDCYIQAGRTDLAEKEKLELGILTQYLPEQLTETELRTLIQNAIIKSGAQGPAEIGKVMKELMPSVKGKADGKLVNTLVQQLLQTP